MKKERKTRWTENSKEIRNVRRRRKEGRGEMKKETVWEYLQ
jgi:hypothetical protein